MKTIEVFPIKNIPPIIHSFSRFNRHSVFVDENGNKFLASWKPQKFPEKETDIYFTVDTKYSYRPDLLAYKFYDNPLLGWVLCYVNDIMNPWDRKNGLYPGRTVRIPDLSTVTAALTF